jgi:hypothetical protein
VTPCPDEDTLQALTEATLSAPETAMVEAHIDGCPRCRALLAALGRTAVLSESTGDRLGPAASVGGTIGRYKVTAFIGAGATGEVYAGYDAALDRKVALKLVRRSSQASSRVMREAKAIARLSHPNVVAVFEVGPYDDGVFLAMELVDGGTLREVLARRELPWREVLSLLVQAGRGLAAAHAAGLVHRDFKPDNVLVGTDGRIRVCDFGLARAVEDDADGADHEGRRAPPSTRPLEATITKTGAILGTPAYMAPEQLRGTAADARADVFAFAVALYEALCGERPFKGTTVRELLDSVESGTVRPSAGARALAVPAALRRCVLRGLAAKLTDRYPSIDAFLVAVDAASRPAWRRVAWPTVAAFVALVAASVATAATGSAPRPHAAHAQPVHGVAITDHPPPASASPEAQAAYAAGLRAMRAGSNDEARTALRTATEKDPDLGAAYVRLVQVQLGLDPRRWFAEAVRLRDQLTDRDRRLLDATAPAVYADPPDFTEAARRLEALSDALPDDAEVADAWANVEVMRHDASAVLRAADRTITLDPDAGDPWVTKVYMLVVSGRFDEAEAAARTCFDRFGANDCLDSLAKVQSFLGDPALEDTARQIVARVPTSTATTFLASALFARGEPTAALRVVYEPQRPRISAVRRAVQEARFAILDGDFGHAREILEAARADASTTRQTQGAIVALLTEIYVETGDMGSALRVARSFVADAEGLANAGESMRDETLTAAHLLVAQGEMPASEFERRRSRLVSRRAPQYGPEGRGMFWVSTYALPASTREEAIAALAALPSTGEPKYFNAPGAPIGKVRLLAGDVDGALPDLERGAREERAFDAPIATVRVHLLLARALEEKGASERACGEYAYIVRRWGHIKPRSLTADEARSRARALRCDSTNFATSPSRRGL